MFKLVVVNETMFSPPHLYFCQSDPFIHVLTMPVLRWHMSAESFCTFGGSVSLVPKLDAFWRA